MKSPKRISTSYLNIIHKLIVDRSVYEHVHKSLSDTLMKIELKRIVLQKEIFIKDFKTISGFVINDFNEEYGEDMEIEAENLRLKFDHLITSHDDKGILSLIIDKEQELSDLYYKALKNAKDDEFIYMILKNQLDETSLSSSELHDLLQSVVNEET